MVVITLFGLTLRHCSYFYAIAPLSELESARAFFCPSYRRSLFARGDTFGVIRSKWPQTGAWLPVLAGTSLIITINNRYTFSHLLPFQQTLNQVPSRFVLLTTLIKSQSNPIAQSLENQYSTEISNDLRDSYERLFSTSVPRFYVHKWSITSKYCPPFLIFLLPPFATTVVYVHNVSSFFAHIPRPRETTCKALLQGNCLIKTTFLHASALSFLNHVILQHNEILLLTKTMEVFL